MYKEKTSLAISTNIKKIIFGKTMLFKDNYEHLPDHVINQSLGGFCYGIKGSFSTFRLKNSTFWEIKATLKNNIKITLHY